MALKDYYRLMGVPREASGEEIKRAYRRHAMQYHPDRNPDDSECESRLKEINEAYQVLGNEDNRRQYDLICHQPFSHHVFYGQVMSDDPVVILREFIRGGFSFRGSGGCSGGGFRNGGCRRRRSR